MITYLIRFNIIMIFMGLSGFTEGDYIKTVDGLFFAVKGGRHRDDLVIAVLRYVPDPDGDRVLDGQRYSRVYNLDETSKFLKDKYPSYVNYIDWLYIESQSVPTERVAEYYKPEEKLQKIMDNHNSTLEHKIVNFVRTMSESSGVPITSFGVSGSMLIGLETENSDIDLNVYGESEGRKVYDALRVIRRLVDWISPYNKYSIEPVLESRWADTRIDLDVFRSVECEKVLHGQVSGIDYFIRLLIEEDVGVSEPICTSKISATVVDASYSIFTPCVYQVKDSLAEDVTQNYEVVELKSYRGKFTEHVKNSDEILARGTIERVNEGGVTFYRLMLGQKGDYLLSI